VEEAYDIGYVSFWNTGARPYCWLDKERIVFARNVECMSFRLVLVNISNKMIRELQVPDGIYSDLQSLQDERHFCGLFSSFQTPSSFVVIDVETGSMGWLLRSGLKMSLEISANFVSPKAVKIPTATDQWCHGLLYAQNNVSSDQKKSLRPAIIQVHGGPTGAFVNRFLPMIQYFASQGWLVLALNYRGSIGYGRAYREMLCHQWGILDYEDCLSAYSYLTNEENACPQQVVVMGGSAGGFTVLRCLSNSPKVFAAGIDFCGVSDLFEINENCHLLEKHYNESLIGSLPADALEYFRRSPCNYAKDIVDPLLILHGSSDTVVTLHHSLEIRKASSGIVEYHEFEGGHMFLFFPSIAMRAYPIISRFLKKHVLRC